MFPPSTANPSRMPKEETLDEEGANGSRTDSTLRWMGATRARLAHPQRSAYLKVDVTLTRAARERSNAQLNVNRAQPSRRLQSTALTCYDSPDIPGQHRSTAAAGARKSNAIFLDVLWCSDSNINVCHLWSTVNLPMSPRASWWFMHPLQTCDSFCSAHSWELVKQHCHFRSGLSCYCWRCSERLRGAAGWWLTRWVWILWVVSFLIFSFINLHSSSSKIPELQVGHLLTSGY